MTIAFDIDGTWDAHPAVFRRVAHIFKENGWDVIIVTGAEQPQDKLVMLGIIGQFPVVVAKGVLKEEAMSRFGLKVDVWVDNEPGTIQRCKIIEQSKDEEL